MKGLGLGLALFLVPALALAAQPVSTDAPVRVDGRLAPRDECAAMPGFAIFRSELARAVKGRDVKALTGLIDPQARLDFGGGNGPAELTRRLHSRQGIVMWRALDQILTLGCNRHRTVATMPWYAGKDFALDDPYSARLVIGRDIPLYAMPTGPRELARLDWVMVELTGGPERGRKRHKVNVPGRKLQGFVAKDNLRGLTDYRLLAEQRKGRWLITAFVAGD